MNPRYHPPEHQLVPSITSEDMHHQEHTPLGIHHSPEAAEPVEEAEAAVNPHHLRNLPPRPQGTRSHDIPRRPKCQTHQYPGN